MEDYLRELNERHYRENHPDLFGISREQYLKWRNPRFGRRNPDEASNTVWSWLIRTGIGADTALNYFGLDPCGADSPAWSFNRNGQSCTILPNGKKIFIGGEHEDFYDPNFYIYNDVIVEHPDDTIEVWIYPEECFRPTDFHTATLVGDKIYIVGCLGYQGQYLESIMVYFLDLRNMSITKVRSEGIVPGWICRHKAIYQQEDRRIVISGGKVIRNQSFVSNHETWSLSLVDMKWTLIDDMKSETWKIFEPSYTLDLDLDRMRYYRFLLASNAMQDVLQPYRDSFGFVPILDHLDKLYQFPFKCSMQLIEDENGLEIREFCFRNCIVQIREEYTYLEIEKINCPLEDDNQALLGHLLQVLSMVGFSGLVLEKLD